MTRGRPHYFRIDIVMLSLLDTYHAVGSYSVGYKFSDLIGAVPLAVVAPALTMLVGAWPDDPAGFRRTFRHALIILTVSAIGAGVGFVIFAGPLVTLFYTDRYASVADGARLLVVGQGLHFFTLLAFSTLVAVGRNRLYPIAMLVGVVLNIGLNIVLIPKYSYMGSGWATVVTEVAVMIVLGLGVARIPGLLPFPVAAIGKCVAAGASRRSCRLGISRAHSVAGRRRADGCGLPRGGAFPFRQWSGRTPSTCWRLPRDDLGTIIDAGFDRQEPGTGMPG